MFACVAVAPRAGCSGPNSRLARAAGVNVRDALAAEAAVDVVEPVEETADTGAMAAGVVFRAW